MEPIKERKYYENYYLLSFIDIIAIKTSIDFQ